MAIVRSGVHETRIFRNLVFMGIEFEQIIYTGNFGCTDASKTKTKTYSRITIKTIELSLNYVQIFITK